MRAPHAWDSRVAAVWLCVWVGLVSEYTKMRTGKTKMLPPQEDLPVTQSMEQWLGECRVEMTRLMTALIKTNEGVFSPQEREYQQSSLAQFQSVPLVLFAVMCATEVTKYKSNLDAYIRLMVEKMNPGKKAIECSDDWLGEMTELLQSIVSLCEYVPHPVT